MPSFQDIELIPGVNTQFTLEANKAGISFAQNIRYKYGMPQKLGGWSPYFPLSVSSSPIRDVHAFQGLASQKFLGIGALGKVGIISCGILTDITPQTTDLENTIGSSTSNFSLSIVSGSNQVEVQDPGSSASMYSGVNFVMPIAIANLLLFGIYPITGAIDAGHYIITSSVAANATIGTSQSSAIFTPVFQSTAGSAILDVTLPNNQFQKILGLFYNIVPPSSFNGGTTLTIGAVSLEGPGFQVSSIIDSTHFQITLTVQSSITAAQTPTAAYTHYYNVQGPKPAGGAYGAGAYGAGPYGVGTPAGQGTGTPIVATDWILDNTGEVLLAVQQNGPIYQWAVDQGLSVMQPVFTGPKINIGGFTAQPQQIFMCYGSEQYDGTRFTGTQDPLLVRWSDSANLNQWVPLTNNAAGSFRIPTGSTLISGVQAPLYGVFWTDIDVWTATWAGQPLIWSFTRVGTACGIIGEHAADVAGGTVYWAGQNNIFTLGDTGVTVLPCSVWDFMFQNIDRTNQFKVRAASNAMFNEVSWFFPVVGLAAGENSAYIKLHIGEGNEYEWDYGLMSRTAWVDTTVLGPPIGSDNNGNIYQHETSFDAAGQAINSFIETGYFAMGDGTAIAIVDWVIPDIRWQSGQYGSATLPGTLLFTFYTTDYPAPGVPGGGGAQPGERAYGPFIVTSQTQFINTRMRGRFWRVRIESNDFGTFWRLGNIKFRWGPAGSR